CRSSPAPRRREPRIHLLGTVVTIVCVSITEAGRRTARRLPYEHVHGALANTVRSRWADVDGLVLRCAVGAAVRVVAPLLGSKAADPAVVCVDEAARFVVPVVGGHAAGANDLARDVAALVGAVPVVTTASDAAGIPALDALPGFHAEGDLAVVTRAWLDGMAPAVEMETPWVLPAPLVQVDVTEIHRGGGKP